MDYKDILQRSARTFFQSFFPVIIAAFAGKDYTNFNEVKTVFYSAVISASAAGLSAVWNLISQYVNKTTNE